MPTTNSLRTPSNPMDEQILHYDLPFKYNYQSSNKSHICSKNIPIQAADRSNSGTLFYIVTAKFQHMPPQKMFTVFFYFSLVCKPLPIFFQCYIRATPKNREYP